MPRPLTVLVLTPGLRGDYFGELLAGLTREVIAAGGRLVVVETLQAAAPHDEAGDPGDFAMRVGWSEVDGVVAITTAVNEAYLLRLRDNGTPVVLISTKEMAGFRAPVAQPDNRGGTRSAVEHLIGHGHTRIGFVGNLAQRDIRDRLAGYHEALERHGLDVDPSLLFAAPENAETGGAIAAQRVLAAPNRPTALMVATDRNAIGVMRTLTGAGLALPRDLAIVAFDNIPAGTFSSPTLTTVNQRFGEVGSLAGRLILAKLRGVETPDTQFYSESAVLMVRESCGCDVDARHVEDLDGEDSPRTSMALAREAVHDVLQRELVTGEPEADRRVYEAVSMVVSDAFDLLALGDQVTNAQIREFSTSLQRLISRPDTLRRFTDAMAEYALQAAATAASSPDGASPVSARVAAALWKVQVSAFLQQAEFADEAIAEQHLVGVGLLDTGGSDPHDLGWLAGTHVKAAALALWEDTPASGQLEIVGTYGTGLLLSSLTGTRVASEHFPPESLVDRADVSSREVCVVVPVSTKEKDWGLLALVTQAQSATAHETYQHWAALLCAALESRRLQEVVRRSALFDSLTGLPNRQQFVKQLEHAIALWQRSRTPFAVLFLDLDGFKLINDSLGHQMGDRVLVAVGADIAGALRAVDTGARFGGDEFVILLTDTEPAGALIAAKRLQDALARVHHFDGHEIVTRASIGIATSDIEYTSAEDVLRDADRAMYGAKSVEPGSVAFFDAPMHAYSLRVATLGIEFQRGLQENQFELQFQPIVKLTSGVTDRFEALVRWRHPEKGLLLPEEFLPAMEETGLIVKLGHWVLAEVCRQLVEWGPQVVNVSINVSDKEFWSQDLLSRVLATLQSHDLEPERLTLEITESVLMRRPELALRLMNKMHDAGLRLHIDEFGTGHSSLETLHRFPVDAFKIDRSFIKTLSYADNSAELIAALVKLGQALGLSVVAEGVETEEQLTFLKEIGCTTGQGGILMPAVSGDDATRMLSAKCGGEG